MSKIPMIFKLALKALISPKVNFFFFFFVFRSLFIRPPSLFLHKYRAEISDKKSAAVVWFGYFK